MRRTHRKKSDIKKCELVKSTERVREIEKWKRMSRLLRREIPAPPFYDSEPLGCRLGDRDREREKKDRGGGSERVREQQNRF